MRNNCAIKLQSLGMGLKKQLAAVDDVGFARLAVLGPRSSADVASKHLHFHQSITPFFYGVFINIRSARLLPQW